MTRLTFRSTKGPQTPTMRNRVKGEEEGGEAGYVR